MNWRSERTNRGRPKALTFSCGAAACGASVMERELLFRISTVKIVGTN
jgi:hypothetical protein